MQPPVFGFIRQALTVPGENKKLKLWTKKELPDRGKVRSANPTKTIGEIFFVI